MAGNRDDILSSFVRMKINEWRASGRELQDLARAAGFGKSTPSQVLLGTGIGDKTGPKFAKAFGYASYDAMRSAAFDWWREQSTTKAREEPPHVIDAAAMVLKLNQGTPDQVNAILVAYNHSRFLSRDYDWWLQTLMTELRYDRMLAEKGPN